MSIPCSLGGKGEAAQSFKITRWSRERLGSRRRARRRLGNAGEGAMAGLSESAATLGLVGHVDDGKRPCWGWPTGTDTWS